MAGPLVWHEDKDILDQDRQFDKEDGRCVEAGRETKILTFDGSRLRTMLAGVGDSIEIDVTSGLTYRYDGRCIRRKSQMCRTVAMSLATITIADQLMKKA